MQLCSVSQIKFCEKLRQLSGQLEKWVIGKGFSMSPPWNPNTEAELEEEDLDYSSCKDPWLKDIRKKIFGEDNRVQISGNCGYVNGRRSGKRYGRRGCN